jgi:polyhydroxybutyrate depolymerase
MSSPPKSGPYPNRSRFASPGGAALGLLGVLAIAAGCRPARGEGRERTGALEQGGRQRTYQLHLPPAFDRARTWPLVLAFHGGGGRGAGFDRQTTASTFNRAADRLGFVVAYPEGVNKGWNDGRTAAGVLARTDVDDLGFVAALIDRLVRDERVDPARVFATGISNGGIFSYRLACDLSDKVAAIAPVAANMAAPATGCHPRKAVAVLAMNGTRDPLVPFDGGPVASMLLRSRGDVLSTAASARFWVEQDRCAPRPEAAALPDLDPTDGTTVRRESYGGCSGGAEVVVYAIDGGGHTWPGGSQYLSARIIGPVSRDIDASSLILEFFARHSRP